MEYYSVARGSLPPELAMLRRDDRVEAIRSAGLGIMDTEIAMRYYIDRLPHADIGAIVDRDRSVVSKRIKRMEPHIISAINLPQ
jgi:hypothetical protein